MVFFNWMVFLMLAAIALFILYWVIRLAVRDALRDVDRPRSGSR